MTYEIVTATPKYADEYRMMCQRVIQATYPNKERGIKKEHFSEYIFNTDPGLLEYWASITRPAKGKKTWFALDDGGKVIGGVSVSSHRDYVEMKTFYVDLIYQGKGVGRALYSKVLEFADSKSIRLDVVEYLDKTIAMYEHWGFKIDHSKGTLTYPWSMWPKEVVEAYKGIYMVKDH